VLAAANTQKNSNNQLVWPVAATTIKPTKQNNNHPLRWPPVTAHGCKKKHNHPVRQPIMAASEGKNHNQTVWFVAASKNNNQPLRPVVSRKNTIILCGRLTRPQAGEIQLCGLMRPQPKNNNQPLRPVICKEKKKQQSTCELGGESSREKQQSHLEQGKTTINLCSQP